MTETTSVLTTVVAPALWGTALATGIFALDQAGFFGGSEASPAAPIPVTALADIPAPQRVTQPALQPAADPVIEVTRATTASTLAIPEIAPQPTRAVKSAPAAGEMQAELFAALSQPIPEDTAEAQPVASRPAPLQLPEPTQSGPLQQISAQMEHDHGEQMPMAAPDRDLAPCVAELQTIASRTRVYFDSNSAIIAGHARQSAYYLASMVSACPEARVEIVGFSDPKGNEDANTALSWDRANATLEALRVGGFDTSPYEVTSHMAIHPSYCTHYDVIDRRVEFDISQADDI